MNIGYNYDHRAKTGNMDNRQKYKNYIKNKNLNIHYSKSQERK